MPQHVIVDGSNLATEGRTLPSLQQLNEAIASYRDDHPDALITVVVDATFGHRIDSKEVAAFEKAIETNAFVAPPAGAVGRGDGFILSIAQKANASILSNDSYQEFHGEYAWLFDDGRLIGGKPVPHVGWVFVNRVPVRGPISRRSVKEQKVVEKSPGRGRGRQQVADSVPAISADGPMPVPRSTPPGAVMPQQRRAADGRSTSARKAAAERKPAPTKSSDGRSSGDPRSDSPRSDGRQPGAAPKSGNDLLAFLSFVEHYPVGTAVTAVVETYSSHGAYVAIGDAKGYVPLRLMADPAPRSAREVMAIGETVTLVVSSFGAARRSIDLAVPSMAPPAPAIAKPRVRKSAASKSAASTAAEAVAPVSGEGNAPAAVPHKRVRKAPAKPPTAKPSTAKQAPAKQATAKQAPAKQAPAKQAPAKQATAKQAPAKQATAKQAAGQRAPAATFDSVFEPEARLEQHSPSPDVGRVPAKRARPAKSVTPPASAPIADDPPPVRRGMKSAGATKPPSSRGQAHHSEAATEATKAEPASDSPAVANPNKPARGSGRAGPTRGS